MDLRPAFTSLNKPNDILELKRILSEMSDSLDIIYSTSAPNGSISARQGRRCLYKNGSNYEMWENVDGSTTWVRIGGSANALWEVDGTETQLATADEIDMQSKNIINLLDPTAAQHAATKNYIDGEFDTSTGHDHDGTDSKKVDYNNLLNTPTEVNNSNVLYAWGGSYETDATNVGLKEGVDSLNNTDALTAIRYTYYGTTSTNYKTINTFRWTKIAGVSTITVQCVLWVDSSASPTNTAYAYCQVDVGGQTGSVACTHEQITPEDKSFTIDVSGLSNGTTYDISIQIKKGADPTQAYLGAVSLIGS